MRNLTIALLALVTLPATGAEVYKCTDSNGRVAFSQRPCGANAQKTTIEGPAEIGTPDANPNAAQNMAAFNRSRQLDRAIARRNQDIADYKRTLDRKIAALRARKARANNNLAGAQLEQSIATEMQAAVDLYDSQVKTAREDVARMLDERRSIEN